MKTSLDYTKIKFPKVGSQTYSGVLQEMIAPFAGDPEKEKTAEAIMVSSFAKELEKLSFGWDYLGKALGASLAGEIGSEVVHRTLYGEKATRDVSQVAKDAITGTVFHAPFAAAAHYGVPALSKVVENAPLGGWKRDAASIGSGALGLVGAMTSPVGSVGMKTVVPLVDYAIGVSPYQEAEKKKKSLQVEPIG